MCIDCIERVVIGDEEHCLAGGDCDKRVSFANKCLNEITEAKERIDYYNSDIAKKVWTDNELAMMIATSEANLLFWQEQFNNYEGDSNGRGN